MNFCKKKEKPMRFYVEMAIEYEAVSEPKALIAAQNIANAAENIFCGRTFITDVRHRLRRGGERSLLKDTPLEA